MGHGGGLAGKLRLALFAERCHALLAIADAGVNHCQRFNEMCIERIVDCGIAAQHVTLEQGSGTMPSLPKTKSSVASVVAKRKSMASVIVAPMPISVPWIAAMTGLRQS